MSCEVDIYGALSEYIGICVSGDTVTLLDINNSVPASLYEEKIQGKFGYDYKLTDTFMGFHCGNTPSCKLCADRAVSTSSSSTVCWSPPVPTRLYPGHLEGDIAPGDITFFRLQSTSDGQLKAYVAQGEVLPVPTGSFGGIGVFAIPEMAGSTAMYSSRKRYPHHGAVASAITARPCSSSSSSWASRTWASTSPPVCLYKTENPFA